MGNIEIYDYVIRVGNKYFINKGSLGELFYKEGFKENFSKDPARAFRYRTKAACKNAYKTLIDAKHKAEIVTFKMVLTILD